MFRGRLIWWAFNGSHTAIARSVEMRTTSQEDVILAVRHTQKNSLHPRKAKARMSTPKSSIIKRLLNGSISMRVVSDRERAIRTLAIDILENDGLRIMMMVSEFPTSPIIRNDGTITFPTYNSDFVLPFSLWGDVTVLVRVSSSSVNHDSDCGVLVFPPWYSMPVVLSM